MCFLLFFFIFIISFQSDFSSFYWLYFKAVLPLNWTKTRNKCSPPIYNCKCKMSACACTCCQKQKGKAAIIMRNVALPVPFSSFLFRLALSWGWRNYSILQQMKNKSVVNNWYYSICSVWLFIYQHIWRFSCSSLLYSWSETKAGRVVYFIL